MRNTIEYLQRDWPWMVIAVIVGGVIGYVLGLLMK